MTAATRSPTATSGRTAEFSSRSVTTSNLQCSMRRIVGESFTLTKKVVNVGSSASCWCGYHETKSTITAEAARSMKNVPGFVGCTNCSASVPYSDVDVKAASVTGSPSLYCGASTTGTPRKTVCRCCGNTERASSVASMNGRSSLIAASHRCRTAGSVAASWRTRRAQLATAQMAGLGPSASVSVGAGGGC